MRRIFILVLLVAIALSSVLTATEVRFGERPFIDIHTVPDTALEAGQIKIKLSGEYATLVDEMLSDNGKIYRFGIEELDNLNLHFGIKEITQRFYSSAFKNTFSDRHKAWGFPLWFELRFDEGQDLRAMVMAYRDLKGVVAWAEPEYKKIQIADKDSFIPYTPREESRWSSNDQYLSYQWHYNNTGQSNGTPGADIKLFNAWDIEKGHPSVIVAIIDDGIQTNHPDLAANIWSGVGYNFVAGNSTIVPGDHGTHVAGTVAAVTNNSVGVAGVAGGNGAGTGARLMSCQVFTSSTNGGFHLAPIWAADNGAAISQNSWSYNAVNVYEQDVLDAIDYFNTNGGGSVMNGGITIFAAGNENSEGNWYPSYYSGAFSVAGTTNQDIRAYYSNYGTWVDVSAPGGETISVSARGVLSTISGSSYAYYQGTSMACPHVSGIAALLVSYAHRNGTSLTRTQVANTIRNTTDNHYAVNPSYSGKLGTGRVNAFAALQAITPGMPNCQITAPASGTHYQMGQIVQVQASASDSDGYIVRVEFYLNDAQTPISTDTTAPYAWNWNTTGYSPGLYTIRAEAVDNGNNRAVSQIEVRIIGPIDEGFESGDFSAYPWTHGGALPWVVQSAESFSGTYAAKSGAITHNESSTLTLPLEVTANGTISFMKRISSESGYDYLRFYIDGNQVASWSGDGVWEEHSYTVNAGSRTFSWVYSKDGSVNNFSDCAWIDNITFPPHTVPILPPHSLTAVPGNGFVTLNWAAPARSLDLRALSGYKVYRNNSLLANTTTVGFTDNNVVNETTYSYYVTAVYSNPDGESEPSNTVQVMPTAVVPQNVILGIGTANTGSQEGAPINIYYKSLHGQSIYTASELNSAGVYGPVYITRLGFFIASAPSLSLPNFIVRLKHTADANVANWQTQAGMITVYSNSSYTPQAGGYEMLDLSTPFLWNGTDNIVVDTAFDMVHTYYSTGTVQYTAVSNGYRFARSDNSNQSNVFTGGSATAFRPNLKLTLLPYQVNPMISVTPEVLDFGVQTTGSSTTLPFTISNTGNTTLIGTITSPAAYTVASAARREMPALQSSSERNTINFSIGAGDSRSFDLTFEPVAAISYNGLLQILSNAENSPSLSLPLVASGVNPATIAVNTTAIEAQILPDSQSSGSFMINNTGGLSLNYNISVQELRTARISALSSTSSGRNITGSTLNLNAEDYLPGSTVDWTFSLYNDSNDEEWLQGLTLTFPAGVTVNSATNFSGGSNGDMIPDATSGNGITIYWEGTTDGGWGVVIPGETATATVNVSINHSFSGILELPFRIDGDVYGTEPHFLTGSLTLNQAAAPITWFALQPQSGSVGAGQGQQVVYSFDATGLSEGNYHALATITSNDPANPSIEIPINLEVSFPATIQITSPQGGESWLGGSTQAITWNYTGSGNSVNFHYTTNGGTSWVSGGVKASNPGVNSFNWVLPLSASENCKVRLTDRVAPNYQAVSATFSIIGPSIVVDPGTINFGTVLIGSTAQESFSISNPGTATLSGNISTPLGYSVSSAGMNSSRSASGDRNTLAYTIPAGSSLVYHIGFSPTAQQVYLGSVIITHNAGGANRTINLTGTGGKPVISLSASTFSQILDPAGSAEQMLTISNLGTYQLSYSLAISGTPAWLNLNGGSSVNGEIASGASSQSITLGFDSSLMSPGMHTAVINGTSNDSANPSFVINVSLVVRMALSSPQNLQVQMGANSSMILSWTASLGDPDGYMIYVSDTPDFEEGPSTFPLAYVAGTQTHYTDTQAPLRPKAFYRVVAVRNTREVDELKE